MEIRLVAVIGVMSCFFSKECDRSKFMGVIEASVARMASVSAWAHEFNDSSGVSFY